MTRRICVAVFLALLLLPAFQAQAQQKARIQGAVSLQGNSPAKGYVVQVGRYWSYTDLKGHYRIDDVPFGKYSLEVKKKGTVVKRAEIDVREPVVTYNVTL